MPRPKPLLIYAAITLGLVALFVVFIAFRRDAALIAALEAAGAVAAAGFAAIAAMGAMRAAAESSASARRSREAVARTVRPRIQPSIRQENGRVLGAVESGGDGRQAIDVTAVWVMNDRGPITDQTPRLEDGLVVDLEVTEGANIWDQLSSVWIEYWDDGRTGQWRDTWQAEPDKSRFTLTHSDLVD